MATELAVIHQDDKLQTELANPSKPLPGIMQLFYTDFLQEYVKSIMYGGLDGIMTTFAIVSSIHAAALHPVVALVLGVANLFADGCSMGVSDYLSDLAEHEIEERDFQQKSTLLQDETKLENEMLDVYERAKKNGDIDEEITTEDIKAIKEIMKKHRKLMVHHLMSMEPEDKSRAKAAKNGLATFTSFILFGSGPLLTYVIAAPIHSSGKNTTFWISIIITTAILFVLGFVKGVITHARSRIVAVLQVVFNGVLVGCVSYLVGFILSQVTGGD